MSRRDDRQQAIRDIVRGNDVRTQRDLVDRLAERGFECTQATVSRDIAEMGLGKLPAKGTYVLPEDVRLRRMVHDLVVDVRRARNLVVVHSASGAAQGVAAALDSAELPGVLGSVAGDDTIIAVAATDEDAERLVELVERLLDRV